MRKILTLIVSAFILIVPGVGFATNISVNDEESHKVVICRPTHSQVHPFVVVSISEHAVKDTDFTYGGTIDAHGHGDPFWCLNNQLGDVCPNLDGRQAMVPEDLVRNVNGECVSPPPVTPPVITTSQSELVPSVTTFQGK